MMILFFGICLHLSNTHSHMIYTNASLFWDPSIMGDNVFLFSRRNHVLRKFRVRKGYTVSSPLTWPSTEKSNGTDKFACPAQWMAAASCRRPISSGSACTWRRHRFYLSRVSNPLWELPERCQSLTSNRFLGFHV